MSHYNYNQLKDKSIHSICFYPAVILAHFFPKEHPVMVTKLYILYIYKVELSQNSVTIFQIPAVLKSSISHHYTAEMSMYRVSFLHFNVLQNSTAT